MNPQLQGIEDIEGTYVFDVRQSVKALRLNRFFWRHREPLFRELVTRDLAAACDELQLTPDERALVQNQDWLGLIRYGVSFFVLENSRAWSRCPISVCMPPCAAKRWKPFSRPGACRRPLSLR